MDLPHLLDQLDPDPKKRGDEFERLCRWYLENAPEYRGRFKQVWLWSDWPGSWGADAGIDLVAEEHDGGLWAIQAKAYDPAYRIKKADVDSFLSEAGRPDFVYRLLIATTDLIGDRARRTIEQQERPVGLLLRSQLEEAPVSWPDSPEALQSKAPRALDPRPHQRDAVEAITSGFDSNDRGQAIMACGTGKTLVGLWASERLEAERTLVLLPSLSLLAQTLRTWAANASADFDYLAVCSDETVTGGDEFVSSTAELGLPVTTDPAEVAAFLRRRGRRVVFSTYQSSPQIAAAFAGLVPHFDLAIADEAHRCAGRVGSDFTTILDPERINAERRLFMTATPRFYTPRVRSEGGQIGVDVASMDDEASFGPVLHRLTFGEAIERDLLSDYRVAVVGVTDSMYQDWAERGQLVITDDERPTDARTLAGEIGLAKAMQKYDLRRIVSFHSRINQARDFAAELPEVINWMPPQARPEGGLWAEHVSGKMSSGQRDARLRHLKATDDGERRLLSNARCLGEGVDLPVLDGVAFIDPRRSTIDIIQALGRAIRKAPDKKIGTIVIPVFIDEDDDPDEVLSRSDFSHVWDVLKALRAHDEQLAEELDDLRRQLGARQAAAGRPGKIILDLPRQIGRDFVEAFDVLLVEQTTASWEFFFGLLESFVEREGHARVPIDWYEGDYRLGQWVSVQRDRAVEQDRRDRLEALPGWAWNAQEASWEDGYSHLTEFVKREGHCRVPQSAIEGDYPLGKWVTHQRHAHARGTLDPERRDRLEALGGWDWNALGASWEDGYARLVKFAEREGHARVPADWHEGSYRLGQWVSVQRDRAVEQDRRDRLEALPGWAWSLPEAQWEGAFDRLKRFTEDEGSSLVPDDYEDPDGFKLGKWVGSQRTSFKRGALSDGRVDRLEALSDWTWGAREASWEEHFAALEKYAEREGHACAPRAAREEGLPIGPWVDRQRQAFVRGTLDPERRDRLEALRGWAWNTREANWEEGYRHLLRFSDREGHCRVPQSADEGGYRLGRWVAKQRVTYKAGKLDPKYQTRLEALPEWAWDTREAAWEEGFGHLTRFVEQEGDAGVPQKRIENGYRLGQWVSNQRSNYKRGDLDADRIARLESVPGWTWGTPKSNRASGSS